MGLFDVFGAGGGTLTLQLQAMQVAPGQMVGGVVTFTGGKRAQNVTSIKVRMTVTQMQPTVPGKPPAGATTTNVVPEQTLSGPFQVQPGQPCPFQFAIQLPPHMLAEVKGHVDYKISASADIPGEVDAHATADIQVIGGAPMGMGMQQPMMGMQQPMMGMQQPMMQAPMGPPQMGEAVIAQHPMGGMHPGKVVAMQNGMVGVDWDDPNLGQSTWLQPQQVQHAAMAKSMMGGMPMQQGMPMGKDVGMHKDMNHMGKDMFHMGKPGMDMHKPGAAQFQIGHGVMAEHPKVGGWHPGRVVGMQNGMIGVDWADPKLGDSTWLQPHQVQPGK